MSGTQPVNYEQMNQKQALAYASNILRTLAADDPELDSVRLLYSARVLDTYGKDMES
jgi:hypothetical protein